MARKYFFIWFLGVTMVAPATTANPLPAGIHPINSLSAGLGLSGVAPLSDPALVFWNPAGLGAVNEMAVDFTVAATTLESPGSWSFLMTNSNAKDGSRLGLAMMRRHSDGPKGEFKSFQINLPLAYGFRTGKLPVGVTLKFISERHANGTWNYGTALDLGTAFITGSGIQIGVTSLNTAHSDLGAFSRETWAGLSWVSEVTGGSLTFQGKIDRPFKSDDLEDNFGFGVAQRLGKSQQELRVGYARRAGTGWQTVGFSTKNRGSNTHFDYTLMINPNGWSDKVHFITYGYQIGSVKPSIAPLPGGK